MKHGGACVFDNTHDSLQDRPCASSIEPQLP